MDLTEVEAEARGALRGREEVREEGRQKNDAIGEAG
jgi:hypothetical protein